MTATELVAAFGPVGGVLVFLAWTYSQRQTPANPLGDVMAELKALRAAAVDVSIRLTRVETILEERDR